MFARYLWLLVMPVSLLAAGSCGRADRDIEPFISEPVATTGVGEVETTVTAAATGAGGGLAAGAGGAGGGFGALCDVPGGSCEDCVQCQLPSECGAALEGCSTLAECDNALACLQRCRDVCQGSDPTCVEGCEASCELEEPGFAGAFDALDCFCRLGCPATCVGATLSACAGMLF